MRIGFPFDCVFLRSEYFKTVLNTDVGERKKSSEAKDFSHEVLSTAVDFMYGIDIPEDFKGVDDLRSLFCLADLYLMGDLKDAVGSRIGDKLEQDNIMETILLTEKFRALELRNKFHHTGYETSPKSWEVVNNFVLRCYHSQIECHPRRKPKG